MRGSDRRSGELFSYVDVATRIPGGHPLRTIRVVVDEALERLNAEFDALYARRRGRPSIPPEMLLRAMLLQAFYSIRSERQLMERLEFDLLFRWFVGLNMDDAVWSATTFSKNRDRLLAGDVAQAFFQEVRAAADAAGLLSSEHFTVDGTLLEAYASLKSFQPKDGPPTPSDALLDRVPALPLAVRGRDVVELLRPLYRALDDAPEDA